MTTNLGPITRPWIVRCQPSDDLRLRFTVHGAHNRCHPIDRDWDVPTFRADDKVLTDQHAMRQGFVQREEEHLAELLNRYPGEQPLLYVGNGNLLANFGFVAWSDGVLYHLAEEPVFKQCYTCLVSWNNGRITVESLWFAEEHGHAIVLQKRDSTVEDITEAINFATSGQPLVLGGAALPLAQIAEQWYDNRQLVGPLCIRLKDVTCFVPNARLQHGLLRKALCQPVHIRPEAEVDADTRIPLTTSGWLHRTKEAPETLATAVAFLKQQGILKEDEHPADPGVLSA
jgi:hypothetical protein